MLCLTLVLLRILVGCLCRFLNRLNRVFRMKEKVGVGACQAVTKRNMSGFKMVATDLDGTFMLDTKSRSLPNYVMHRIQRKNFLLVLTLSFFLFLVFSFPFPSTTLGAEAERTEHCSSARAVEQGCVLCPALWKADSVHGTAVAGCDAERASAPSILYRRVQRYVITRTHAHARTRTR